MQFAKNVRELRKRKGETQAEVAEALDIARGRWAKYEEGRAEPPLELLERIAEHFDIPLDRLLSSELEPSSSLSDEEGEGDEREVPVIPGEATAGYLSGYGDPEDLEELERIRIPFLPSGTLRAFPVRGDSMWPVQDGSYVIGRYVPSPDRIRNGRSYVVVSRNEGISYKRVWKEGEADLLLVPDNERYEPYRVEGSSVMELWEYVAHISTQEYDPHQVGWKSAADELKRIEVRLEKLRESLGRSDEKE